MWKRLTAAALILTTTATQSPADPSALGPNIRALTDAEMKIILPGTYIRQILPANVQDRRDDEQFNIDGTHLLYADNAEIEGHYVFKGGKVCVKDEFHPEYCRIFAVDRAGRYFQGVPTYLVPVSIKRLRGEAPVPSIRFN